MTNCYCNILAASDGLRQLILFVIVMVIYGLTSLFKNKPKPPRQSERPAPQRPRRPQPPARPQQSAPPQKIPPYARGRIPQQQPRPTSSQTAPRPTAQRPVPRPPTSAQPRPTPPTPSKPPTTRRTGIPAPPPQKPLEPEASGAAAYHDRRREKMAEQLADRRKRTYKTAETFQQAADPQSLKSSHQRRSGHVHRKTPTAVAIEDPLGHLDDVLEQTSPLARAIIHAEVLGKPMALRPMGSHDFTY